MPGHNVDNSETTLHVNNARQYSTHAHSSSLDDLSKTMNPKYQCECQSNVPQYLKQRSFVEKLPIFTPFYCWQQYYEERYGAVGQ
jgi:hypothetical protein